MLTLPSARRSFSNDGLVQVRPFAQSASALLRICFPARRSEERATQRPKRDRSRTTQLCQPCFQNDLTLGNNAVFRFHSLELLPDL